MSYAALTVCAAGAWLPGCVSCRYASFCKWFSSVSVNHTPAVTLVIMSVVALHHCARWLCRLPYLLSSSLCFVCVCVDSEGPLKQAHIKQHHCNANNSTGAWYLWASIDPLFVIPAISSCFWLSFLSSLPPSFSCSLLPSFLPSCSYIFGMCNLLLIINRQERWRVLMNILQVLLKLITLWISQTGPGWTPLNKNRTWTKFLHFSGRWRLKKKKKKAVSRRSAWHIWGS